MALIPWVFIPFLNRFEGTVPSRISTLIFFLGSGFHVAATSAIYVDPGARDLLREQRLRAFLIPPLMVGTSSLLWALTSPDGRDVLLLLYFSWQTHHYTKQNQGVISFSFNASGLESASRAERRLILFSGGSAIVAMWSRVLPVETLPLGIFLKWSPQVGLIGYSLSAAIATAGLIRAPQKYLSIRGVYIAAALVFYLPLFIYRSPSTGVAAYALAHGFQYLVFIGYLEMGIESTRRIRIRANTIALTIVGGILLWVISHRNTPDLVFGGYLGLIMSHFVVDAGIWKLRHKTNREYVLSRYSFMT